MVRAMLNECDRIGATLVWRASMPDHTRYDENGNALLRKLNTAALAALDAHARERPGGSHFAFRTAYLLGAARPDRTSDGFHYGFRQVDRYRSWRWHAATNARKETPSQTAFVVRAGRPQFLAP